MKLKPSATLEWVTPNAERIVVRQARVSAPENQGNNETAPRLIRYLIKHKHWSSFEMASMCVEISTTRAISQQIIRHSSFHFQEYSQRYAPVPKAEVPALRRIDSKNRQNSFDDLDDEIVTAFQNMIQEHFDKGYDLYESMLEAGVAKECARAILPICSPTKMYMTGTLRDWLFYLDLRSGKETQWEHRTIANQIKDIFSEQFPTIYEAFWCTP